MKQYYECHITMLADEHKNRHDIELAVRKANWSFSAIDKDIVLGPGVKLYATKHFEINLPIDTVKTYLENIASTLKLSGINVIRRKVELVVYDVTC